MHAHDVTRNLLLYRIYTLFNEPLFWGPILITSLQKLAHMPLSDIYYMESVVLCICVVIDIPSGALADLIGRKRSLIIARVFYFVGACFFTIMTTPLEAWIGNVLVMIGVTMQSGADTALLYDTLLENGRQHEYTRVEGKSVGARFALAAVCSIATGLLAEIDLRLPLWLALPFILIPLVVSLFFKEPVQTKHYSAQEQLRVLKEGLSFAFRSVEVRWMLGLAALLTTASKVWFFTYNPYFELVEVPLTHYGFIFFCLNVVAWLSSHYAHQIEKRLGERVCVTGMILCISVPVLIMGYFPVMLIAYLVVIQNVTRGFMRPFIGNYMNRHIESTIRATILSTQSSIANLAAIVGLAMFGFLIDQSGLLPSLITLGFVVMGFGAFSYAMYAKKIA